MGVKTIDELRALPILKYEPGMPGFLASKKESDDLICGEIDGEVWQPVMTDRGLMRIIWRIG